MYIYIYVGSLEKNTASPSKKHRSGPLVQDLAIDLRVRLGDWFRVIQLAHGANEAPR